LLDLFPDKPWIRGNYTTCIEIIKKYPKHTWHWRNISRFISMRDIELNLDLPWDDYGLSENQSITWEFVQVHPEICWNYKALARNKNITWDIVQAYPEIEWDYRELSCNPNITEEILLDYPDADWDYNELSDNENISWKFISENLHRDWDINEVCICRADEIGLEIILELVTHYDYLWDILSYRRT